MQALKISGFLKLIVKAVFYGKKHLGMMAQIRAQQYYKPKITAF
jgi:hypothetical protein